MLPSLLQAQIRPAPHGSPSTERDIFSCAWLAEQGVDPAVVSARLRLFCALLLPRRASLGPHCPESCAKRRKSKEEQCGRETGDIVKSQREKSPWGSAIWLAMDGGKPRPAALVATAAAAHRIPSDGGSCSDVPRRLHFQLTASPQGCGRLPFAPPLRHFACYRCARFPLHGRRALLCIPRAEAANEAPRQPGPRAMEDRAWRGAHAPRELPCAQALIAGEDSPSSPPLTLASPALRLGWVWSGGKTRRRTGIASLPHSCHSGASSGAEPAWRPFARDFFFFCNFSPPKKPPLFLFFKLGD